MSLFSKDVFLGYGTLGWQLLSFSILKTFYFHVVSTVSVEKSPLPCCCSYECERSLFTTVLKIFFILALRSFILIVLDIIFSVFVNLGTQNFLNLWLNGLHFTFRKCLGLFL